MDTSDDSSSKKSQAKGMVAQAKDKAAAVYAQAEPKIQEVKDAVNDKYQQVKEVVTEKYEQAKEKAQPYIDQATDKAHQLTGKAKATASDAADKASDLKDQATDKAQELKGKAKAAASDVSDKASDLKDQASDKASELKGKAKAKASDAADKASDAMETDDSSSNDGSSAGLLGKLSHLKDQAVAVTSDFLEKGKEYVVAHTPGIASSSSSTGVEATHTAVPNDGQEHKVTQVYTMTEKEVGKDKDGHPIIEKSEKWEERLDDGPAKVVKAHSDRITQ